MKILIGIKRVVDYNVRIRVLSDGSGVDTDGVKMSVNPFDEIALEEALRIREAGKADEVIVVSAGPDECQQQLRTGLAMGADRAIQIQSTEALQPLSVARAFLKIIEREDPGLVILGKQALLVVVHKGVDIADVLLVKRHFIMKVRGPAQVVNS